ncbi:hypothetical protein X777_05170 [Ooceraea biroi]|uniref:Uncharacterized protein n=1 Tax=Ooceraea biroi TaxID=2015173 RepID=A0A026WGS4_OOCBI|nr:hypothetical protein X777_05170 [Ooceraea biroi]
MGKPRTQPTLTFSPKCYHRLPTIEPRANYDHEITQVYTAVLLIIRDISPR